MSQKGLSEAGYLGSLPAPVRYDEELSASAKIFYAELTALSDKHGYCWAKNEYFETLFGVAKSTISRWFAQLEKKGFICCEMVAVKTGSERRVYTGLAMLKKQGCTQKCVHPPGVGKNAEGGIRKNAEPHNVDIVNNSEIPPKAPQGGRRGRREPKETAEWKPERFEAFWAYYRQHCRGEDRQGAIRAWDKLRPDTALIQTIARALARQVKSESWQAGIGIPYASTYLNNRRWEDVPKETRQTEPEQDTVGSSLPLW